MTLQVDIKEKIQNYTILIASEITPLIVYRIIRHLDLQQRFPSVINFTLKNK